MKRPWLLFALCWLSIYPAFAQEVLRYPQAPKQDQVDVYFDTPVSDPYRYLENSASKQTQDWLKSQEELSGKFFRKLNYRYNIKARIKERYYYEQEAMIREGNYYFHYMWNDLNSPASLYYRKRLGQAASLLIDPARFDRKGAGISEITHFKVSGDGAHIAFCLSRSGSDWKEIRVMEMGKGRALPDLLRWVKSEQIAWKGNGFYYCRLDEPPKGGELTAINGQTRIYYHTLGTTQEEDRLIYEQPSVTQGIFSVETTEDERFLLVYGGGERGGKMYTQVYVQDFNDSSVQALRPFISEEHSKGYSFRVCGDIDGRLLVMTEQDAPNKQLLLYDPARLNQYSPFIPERPEILQEVRMTGGRIVCIYRQDMRQFCVVSDRQGRELHRIAFPPGVSAGGLSGSNSDSSTLFYEHSYTSPPQVCRLNVYDFQLGYPGKARAAYAFKDLVSEQVFYTSEDGTRIPMTLVYKKGMKQDRSSPTILYGYGGYGVPVVPFFDPGVVFWLENGGLFAVPGVRGGGEYGEAWHKAGQLFRKKNAIADLVAAAGYLIGQGYTDTSLLAARGSSNGGLMVVAAANERPELFSTVIAEMGIYDLLRYQHFTRGFAWADEYGSSVNEDEFRYLYTYSPLHNVQAGKAYPAMFIVTADHDDRVPPLHSYKLTATLQERIRSTKPVLLRVQKDTGHAGANTIDKQLEEEAYIYTFIFEQMHIPLRLGKK